MINSLKILYTSKRRHSIPESDDFPFISDKVVYEILLNWGYSVNFLESFKDTGGFNIDDYDAVIIHPDKENCREILDLKKRYPNIPFFITTSCTPGEECYDLFKDGEGFVILQKPVTTGPLRKALEDIARTDKNFSLQASL